MFQQKIWTMYVNILEQKDNLQLNKLGTKDWEKTKARVKEI